MFQKSCRSIKHSACLALRLLGGSWLRLSVQTGHFNLEIFTSSLLWEHQGAWCKSRLQYRTQPLDWVWEARGSNILPAIWQRLPCHSVVGIFHKTFWYFKLSLLLRILEVFMEIFFSHLSLEKKRMSCMCSFPSFNVSILNSTQRLNWFLSFHLLSSSEEHF